MKKYIAITLAAALILSSAACKKAPDAADDTVILAGSDTESAESDVKSPETEQADDLPLIIPEEQVPDEELPADEDADVMPDFTSLARPKPEDYIYGDHEKIVDPETDPKAKRLIEVHGDGLVVRDHNNSYTIIFEDQPFSKYGSPPEHKTPSNDGWTRASIEEWEGTMNLDENLVIRGTPTGRSLHRSGYFVSDSGELSPLCANTMVEVYVAQSYYGEPHDGRFIWIDSPVGITYSDGKLGLSASSGAHGMLFDGIEYLLHVTCIDGKYSLDVLEALRLDVEYLPFSEEAPGALYSMYEKYFIDKEYALVRETEILRYRTLNFRLWYNEHFSEHQGNPDKTWTDPEFAPTAEQLATIDKYIEHYNAKLP